MKKLIFLLSVVFALFLTATQFTQIEPPGETCKMELTSTIGDVISIEPQTVFTHLFFDFSMNNFLLNFETDFSIKDAMMITKNPAINLTKSNTFNDYFTYLSKQTKDLIDNKHFKYGLSSGGISHNC